jgi:hypothetical protein
MLTKETLREIGREVLAELRLSPWKVYYADMDPEILFNRQADPKTAWSIRFNLVGNRRFFIIYLRAPHAPNTKQLRQSIKVALTERLREIA